METVYTRTKDCGCIRKYRSVNGKPEFYCTVMCKLHEILAQGNMKVITGGKTVS